MVRETRHLWVGNLPDNIREDRIRDHFKRYGRVQSVKLLGGRGEKDEVCATVSFMDIKSAAKAHHSEQKLDERVLTTEYHEPAAIPPPNYSRFHSLGSEELSSSFDRSSHFYDREGAGGYIRRSGSYHSQGESLSRNRTRDRTAYRNGPYTPIIESVVSRSGGSSSHHGSSRSGTWTYDSPSPRYPPSTPDISYQEPAPIIVHKKHSKSRSGSDTGSNSSRSRSSSASSQSGSSTCSTASSSPTSEKSCSTHHSQQSNIRSSGAPPSAANHTNSNSPAVHSEDRRPLAICVRNLPARSSDTSLKDGLYHEYKKHGKVTWVKVVGQGVDRYALVSFKKPEDVDKALQVSHDKLFFGCKIEVAPYQGYDVDDNEFRPFEAEQDEFHPKATRTLFIGNLDKDITTQEIRKHFDQFGEIIFSDIGSVVRAMRSLDGEHVGNSGNRVKLGFGKSMHTSCVWVDGVAETVSEKYLSQQFGQFGPVSHVVIDRARGQALVSYEQITYAQQAVKEMRGAVLRGRKLQVDYASRECQESFYDHMEKQSSSSTHPPFENSSSSVAGSPQNLRVFESPSSSSTAPCTGTGNSVTNRYNSCSRYSTSRSSSYARSSSPSRSRHSSNRFQDYPSSTATGQEYERRPSYRSYEDMTQVEENNTPTTGTGDIRHLQKERVSLLEQLEDCTSSGEEGTNRRRCNKHRRSQSGESSRPGTPLCDERPENLGPVEPRRPRESRPPDPLSLPLPRFASQVLSPRPAPPSPPASPQTHSSSSDSEPSPEWEERLRSLDEKYEKWSSGSRAGLTKVDLSTFKVRHKLLELDLHELQPSEIVKSVLAKRSVFDEDSKRLENFGEKYEPREFVPARPSLLRGRLDLSPMSSPIAKSPSSPAAKGLQYPFPSHPPVQPTTSVATTTAPTSTTVTVAATEIKPTATTFLTNCTPARQFPLPKISSPQAEKCESNIRLTCTKVLPSAVSTVKQTTVPCKPPLDIKKEQPPPPLITKIKSNTPVRRESSDDKKDESRRKSRDESVESVKSGDSVKREDTSECDKVRDSQITERRKSISEKRRSSSEHKEINCERTKDPSEKRRGSSEIESETTKRNECKKNFEENHVEMPKLLSEPDKISRKVVSDSIERRKETESNIRPNSDQEKKKDVFGVNSEKDRRRNRESVDTSDNPKHSKKVPDIKKDVDSVDKRDKDEDVKAVELDKKKEISDQSNIQNVNRHKEKKDHQDRRRDSSEHSEKKSERISPENSEVHRIKDKKANNHDLSESRNSKKQNEENEVKLETVKHKDPERRKNSENEISKEHSLFKKVFGFAERTYGHHKDRRDSDSTAVKTDDTIKHRRDHSEKDRKRDKDSDHSESSSSSKHKSRKSPDQPENNRHKERKHSESSEKRIRKDLEQSDDHKQKSDHLETFQSKSRERKEERSSKESSKNIFHSEHLGDLNTFIKHNDRRKDPSLDESRNSESDSNDLKSTKDGESKKDNEVFFERRKEENAEGRSKGSNERRKDSVEKYFDNDKYTDRSKRINDESDIDKKNDSSSDIVKYKHERHRDNDRKRDHLNIENCRTKEPKEEHRQREEVGKHKDERKTESDLFDCIKSKDENYRYRDYSRKKDNENQDQTRVTEKKKEEKEKKKDREPQESIFKARDSEEKCTDREIEKLKRSKEFDLNEGKVNGDHDDYCLDSIDYRKPNFDEEHHAKKEKRKERSSWPATIGCKRRLSSQDSLEIVDDAKRSKPERRDSKDSGRSSGSSRKSSSEKHKGFTKLLEEKIKEDKEREQRKKEDSMIETNLQCDDKMSKPAIRKEKRNSGEKRKEERKFKSRPRENGTASESDLCSGDEEAKANKRQHSIFDIVDDEPAYISMYDKVKARSTKNMQKQEEEKRQEKLKEKFHQLKASRAKREEKKRSTSYDEDSDSEKGGSRRSNKLLITSSEDEACSENDVRVRARKVLCDTSEDDTVTTPRSRSNKYSDYETKSSRKIISDISEDDSLLKHSTPKIKSTRNISFESDMKTRKIMSDTSEDDSTRQTTPRQKPSRIQSDDSEGDLGFEDSVKPEPIAVEPFIEPVKITDVFASRPVEMNHFASNDLDQKQLQLQSSPENLHRMPLCNSVSSEQPRKKSHKKKTKKKNYEVSEDGTIIVRKHSSKKEKKKSHRDDDDDKKSRKKKSERESSSNKREEKFEDIFGPLSDDSEKAAMSKWQVSQVYGSDSESERENIRKKEKKRKEKKLREQLDEAGRALEAKLLDTSEDVTEEPVKTKKKKRKKSRDEKIKHHRVIDEETLPPLFSASIEQDSTSDYKRSEPESVIKESEPETKQDTERETDVEKEDEESKMETDFEENVNKEDISLPRQHSSSLSSLLDSPPAQLTPTKKPDIPGFGTEVDETIHETAVKSISESTIEDSPLPQDKFDEKPKPEDVTSGDKPTPIISQEETEDAVAALLMEETFGSSFERYSDDATKPDTPVSEPDLQIDTDTEDTFDPIDFSKAAKSPEPATVSFCPSNDTREGLEERIMSLACSTEPSLKEQEKPQTEVKKDPPPSDKTDSETDQPDQSSEKPAIIKSPVIENSKSEEPVKTVTKDPPLKVVNEDKPIEIDDEDDDDDEDEELETSKSDKNISSDKLESSTSSLETVKSSESIEMSDKVISIDVKEVHSTKQVDDLSHATLLTQSGKHENQQQQEHIRHQPQLQNQQKEPLIQQKEVLQKPPHQQLQKPQQPQQLPPLQPQLPLPSQHQPQVPQQLQNQHQTQQQVQTQHQAQQPVQSQHQTQHPVQNQHHTQQLVQPQHHTPQPVQPQHQTQQPVQSQHQNQHTVQNQHQTHHPLQSQHHTQQPVQNQHHAQQPVQNQHHVQHQVQNQHHNQQPVQSQHPVQNLLQPQQLPLLQKQPIQPQQFQHQQIQKQQQSLSPQQLHHSQHQPQVHQQQQQVIKPVIQEKPADQPSNLPPIASANFQKSEKIIHQQVMPQHHNTVLVHQAQAQPQTAQVVKPLSVQVINSPVIKSLDQSVVKHSQPHPKLNSPPGLHTPQTTPTTALQPKPPLHHISYQGRMPNPLPHLIPPHLPVKPTGQISLQAPQLTPLVKAGLATSPRPLPVHTIQNPQNILQNQKQLHVVTQNLQHSPQPPVSPQNLKVIRPVHNPNIRSPMPQQQQSPIRPPMAPIPLLQTVSTPDGALNKQYVRPPQHSPNTHLLQCNPSQVPHPEKVMNLSPSLPIQNAPVALTQKSTNVSTIKTNETICKSPFQPENSAEKQNTIRSVEFNTNVVQESISVVQTPKILVNSNEAPINESPLPLKKMIVDEVQLRAPLIESKPNTKTNIDENKPLNAVIQDLTLRATNKVLGNTHPNTTNAEIKSETPRPIDQVVRELQLRKKSISAPGESEKPTSINETKIKEENEDSKNVTSSNTNSSLKQETQVESMKKEPLSIPEEIKNSDEPVKVEIKEEKGREEVPSPKEESKTEKEDIEIPRTPPNAKLEVKQQLSPHTPESKTPKSSKEPEQDIPSSDERVIPSEKSIPPSGSGRGRGGRRRKLGRGGASGVTTRRGGRHATTTVSSPAPPARPQVPADVYEFRDDSEEERPRLILTIKPEQPSQSSSSIVPSTRKSRRLQEKDGTRTMIDDSVEEIIRGPGRPSRRATRSTAPLLSTPVVETTRKSPRRKQAVASNQAPTDHSPTPQPVASPQNPPTPQPGVHTQQPVSVSAPEPPGAALVSTPSQVPAPPPVQPPPVQVAQPAPQKQPEPEVVQALQQLLPKEPPKLLSPPRIQQQTQPQPPPQPVLQQQQQQPMPLPPQPIISQAQQVVKPIHKLTPLSKPEIKVGPIIQQRPGEMTNLIDPVTGLLIPMREGEEGQYIPVGGGDSEAPPEKRMRLEDGITKAPVAAVRPSVVRPPQQSPHAIPKPASPPRLPQKPVVNSTIPRPPKAHLLQAVAAERAKMMPRPRPKLVPSQAQQIQAPKPPTPMTPKAHILQAIGNAAQAREGVIGSPAPHQGSILTGSVASPPLRVHPQPMVTGASSTRFVERPGGRLAAEGGCIVVPSASPQPPPRGQVMQAGLPVPAYEASLGDVVQHVSGYGHGHHIQPAHYVHPQLMYQQYLREAALGQSPYHRAPGGVKEVDDPVVRGSPPLELRRRASPHDRTTDSPQVATLYGRPHLYPPPPAHRPAPATRHQVATPPHASQVPPQGDSLLVLLQRYPVMWQGLLALKNDQAAVQMHFVFGNPLVARDSLPCNSDGSTPPLRISQRMRLEQTQLDGVARKMQMDNEHCMLLALPCGRDHMDVLQQSNNLQSGFITYLQQKQAAGIVNIAAPGSQQAAYVVHIFPASEFANDSLARIAPDLLHRVTDIAHLLIVIATV